jgi:arginine-tRNA-protein transferase
MERTCCPQYTIRLKAKEFKLTKGQKKILSKFNRYIQGTWSPDKDHQEKENNTKKPPKDNTPKQLMDYIHALDNSSNNKHDLKVNTTYKTNASKLIFTSIDRNRTKFFYKREI